MTMFQLLSVTALGLLLGWEFISLSRRSVRRAFWGLRCITWTAAIVAIVFPELVTRIALTVGIRRGADLVMYAMALAFLGTTFFFYSRYVRLQVQITELVRHLAIMEAQRSASNMAGPALDRGESPS